MIIKHTISYSANLEVPLPLLVRKHTTLQTPYFFLHFIIWTLTGEKELGHHLNFSTYLRNPLK